MIDKASTRFESKRDSLQSDYDQNITRLRENSNREMTELEDRLEKKLQRALDNPLSD